MSAQEGHAGCKSLAMDAAINTILTNPHMKVRRADTGGTALTGSPADFAKIIAEETGKMGNVVKASDAKAEWAVI